MDYYMLLQSMSLANTAISTAYDALILQGTGLMRLVDAPPSPSFSGISGYNVAFSGNYFYACTGENQWGRVQISRFSQPLYCNSSEYYSNNAVIYCNASGT